MTRVLAAGSGTGVLCRKLCFAQDFVDPETRASSAEPLVPVMILPSALSVTHLFGRLVAIVKEIS